MKKVTIGVFSDTHANAHALKAILDYYKCVGCDEIIHLGDIVCMGAHPEKCLERLLHSDIVCIMGNHDYDYLRGETAKKGNSHVPPEHKRRIFELAGESYKKEIQALPYVVYREWFGLVFAFTHYARYYDPIAQREKFFKIEEHASPSRLDEMFCNIQAQVVFFGHKHAPSCDWGKRLYMDAGSLACHKGSNARGLLLKVYEDKTFSVERVYAPYDRQASLQALKQRNIPGFEEMQDYYYSSD